MTNAGSVGAWSGADNDVGAGVQFDGNVNIGSGTALSTSGIQTPTVGVDFNYKCSTHTGMTDVIQVMGADGVTVMELYIAGGICYSYRPA